ncbi:MAG: ComEC/Rec2 family competence protein [Ruminococcus sp.]|nr:ComEC/Rec2 family competence protein [Ruminococcus sp.]
MKRLLEMVGLIYLSVLAVVFSFGKILAFIIGAVALLLFIFFMAVKKYRKTVIMPTLACVALVACVANLMYTEFFYEKTVETYDGCSANVTATMIEEPYKSGNYYRYSFKTKTIGDKNKKLKFIAYHHELLDIEPYDTINVNLEFNANDHHRDLSKKYFLLGDMGYETPSFTTVGKEKSLYRYAILLRQNIRKFLSSVLSEESFPLCSALLIGDKYLLSDAIRNDFTKAGASHVIVVSGMHFSILASIFLLLARKYHRHRYMYSALALVFVFVYMAITGYTPSVLRSGIMLIICCIGVGITRDSYSGNSLGFAAIVITITNPYSVGDIGLVLSFASTYSIISIAPYLQEKFFKRIKMFKVKKATGVRKTVLLCANKAIYTSVSVLCMNISATIVSIPLSILYFGSVSTVSVFSTLALYFPIQLLLILTLLITVLGFVPFLVPMISLIIELLSSLCLIIVEFFADLPFSYLYVKHNYVYLWVLMSVILFSLMLYSNSKTKVRVFVLSCVMVFISGYISVTLLTYSKSSLYVYDVGEGIAVMYSDDDVNAVLSLECNKNNTYNLLNSLQRTVSDIDFCASVSDTNDGLNSLSAVTKVFAISDVLLYDTKRTVVLSDTTDRVTQCQGDVTVNLSDEVTVFYLMVDNDYVVYLQGENKSVLVLPYSVDAAQIDERYRNADIIVARCCPANYELLRCDTLVISNDSEYLYHTMSEMSSVSNKIFLTADSDVEIKMEV